MFCDYCRKDEKHVPTSLVLSRVMIDGSKSLKSETINTHQNSAMHKWCENREIGHIMPEETKAAKCLAMYDQHDLPRVELKMRNVHALVKHNRPFTDMRWLCRLDQAKGLDIGETYTTHQKAKEMSQVIADLELSSLANKVAGRFFSLISDGSTDSSFKEEEILYIRFSNICQVETSFVGIGSPPNPTAAGIHGKLIGMLDTCIQVDEQVLSNKLVAFACDGAAVMMGKYGGVSRKFADMQSSLLIVHCMAHRYFTEINQPC